MECEEDFPLARGFHPRAGWFPHLSLISLLDISAGIALEFVST